MATQLCNVFTSFQLNEDEQKEASKFTIPQIQGLQNLLSQYATDRLKIVYEAGKIEEYIAQDYFAKGAIEVLEFLISTSNTLQELEQEQHYQL